MSTIQRAYKTEIDLNDKQISVCRKHAGAARWAYNWGVQRKQEAYRATGTSPSAIDLHRELNALKQTQVPWMYEVSKCGPQEALRNLDRAFDGFFRRAQLKQAGQLPRLGRLRVKERGYLPTTGTLGIKVHSATVSEHADHWYVSVLVEHAHTVPANTGQLVGVDLGLKMLAMLSDGAAIPNPRPLKRRLKKIKRLHRAVTRKQKGSQNRKKAVRTLGAAYRTVANLRANTLHHLTSRLAKTKSVVVLEDLNVAWMLRNHALAQAVVDVGFAEFRRQLEYKAAWYGCRVVVADHWFASSKTCSSCGWVDEHLTLADRTFRCQACGLMLDRDRNAAINLAKLAGSSPDSLNACREGSADWDRETPVKLSSMKQEPDTVSPSG